MDRIGVENSTNPCDGVELKHRRPEEFPVLRAVTTAFLILRTATHREMNDVNPPLSTQPLVKSKHEFLKTTVPQIYGLNTAGTQFPTLLAGDRV
jgi:hypothetical protein